MRLKKDQINDTMLGYLRMICLKTFFSDESSRESAKKILLTRCTNLFYERFIFRMYLIMLVHMQQVMNSETNLEQDLELLQRGGPGSSLPKISFELQMAVFYRAEKKQILISQINLIQKVV